MNFAKVADQIEKTASDLETPAAFALAATIGILAGVGMRKLESFDQTPVWKVNHRAQLCAEHLGPMAVTAKTEPDQCDRYGFKYTSQITRKFNPAAGTSTVVNTKVNYSLPPRQDFLDSHLINSAAKRREDIENIEHDFEGGFLAFAAAGIAFGSVVSRNRTVKSWNQWRRAQR